MTCKVKEIWVVWEVDKALYKHKYAAFSPPCWLVNLCKCIFLDEYPIPVLTVTAYISLQLHLNPIFRQTVPLREVLSVICACLHAGSTTFGIMSVPMNLSYRNSIWDWGKAAWQLRQNIWPRCWTYDNKNINSSLNRVVILYLEDTKPHLFRVHLPTVRTKEILFLFSSVINHCTCTIN